MKIEVKSIPFSNEEQIKRASRFILVETNPQIQNEEIFIERKQQRDGSYKYAICKGGRSVLTKESLFEWEPSPSNRDEDYLARARYASLEEAWDFWNNWVDAQQKLSSHLQDSYFKTLTIPIGPNE
jgi:hypothetical protein